MDELTEVIEMMLLTDFENIIASVAEHDLELVKISDSDVNEATKILRLLYIQDLKSLQTSINEFCDQHLSWQSGMIEVK